jgi:outer membrane lipoprotein SlyB
MTRSLLCHSDLSHRQSIAGWIIAVLAGLFIGGCATSYDERTSYFSNTTREVRLPPTQVYFYSNHGQSAAQQDRDRYECYQWERKQTRFDPSQPQVVQHVQVEVIPSPPPGTDTAVGAVTGALIGAAVSRPGDGAEGAAVGALAGTLLGAVSDSARQEQAERIETRYYRSDAQRMADLERRASDFRRAMAACLEGRGYTVR